MPAAVRPGQPSGHLQALVSMRSHMLASLPSRICSRSRASRTACWRGPAAVNMSDVSSVTLLCVFSFRAMYCSSRLWSLSECLSCSRAISSARWRRMVVAGPSACGGLAAADAKAACCSSFRARSHVEKVVSMVLSFAWSTVSRVITSFSCFLTKVATSSSARTLSAASAPAKPSS